MADIQVNIKMPEELREKAQAEAEKKLLSLSDIIRMALLEFLEKTIKESPKIKR